MTPFDRPPLNLLPSGLLDFFGIKSMGRYPQYLDPDVKPTFELSEWYGEFAVNTYNLTAAASPIGTQAGGTNAGWSLSAPVALPTSGGQIVVPDGELWLVRRYTVFWIIAAGVDQVELIPHLQRPQIGSVWLPGVNTRGPLVGNAGATVGNISTVEEPFFLRSGDAPRWMTLKSIAVGATTNLSGSIDLARLRV